MSLAFAGSGDVTITEIRAEEKLRRHLSSLGLSVGSRMRILSAGGDVIVCVRGARLALDRALAQRIQVEACV